MLQIGVELISGIGLCGKFTRGVKRVPEVRRGSESFCFACEIQVEPEEGMIGEIPECWVIRLFLIAPEAFIPMRAGTGQQGVLKHIDGRAELLPQSEERRVGKECKSRSEPYHYKKKQEI